MAQSVNLKPFYVALGIVAVAGGAWIVSSRGGGPVTLPEIVSVQAYPGYSIGSDSAKVEIIEYADFECPACAMFTILTSPDVKSRLVNSGRVRLVFRDFPLPIHSKAAAAHLAAACAGEQGQFWAMHDQLFYNQGAWVRGRERSLFDDYAQAIGINTGEFGQCMKDQRHVDRIAATRNEGQQLGISSTPSFIIGDQLVSGAISLDEIIALVERAEMAAEQG
jgi:protein-disulfide isomerase